MQQHPSLRSLRVVAYSFVPVMLGGLIAVIALDRGWEDMDRDLAQIGEWVAGGLGILGLLAAVTFRSRVTERPVAPKALTTRFFITAAIAESSLLAGFVFSLISRSARPFFVGLGAFALALAIILTSFNQVEVQGDGAGEGLIR